VSDDDTRPHLSHAWLDTKRSKLVATDGHCMVVLPVEKDAGKNDLPRGPDTTGAISKEALVAARQNGGILRANGKLYTPDDRSFERPHVAEYPPYDKVMPERYENELAIGISPKLIWAVARALGHASKKGGLQTMVLRINLSEPLSPIRVTMAYDKSDAEAIIMPMRIK